MVRVTGIASRMVEIEAMFVVVAQVRSGLIDLLLVTCNPVLPASGSSSR